MNKKLYLLIIITLSVNSMFAQTVGFTGVGRALFTNNTEKDKTKTDGKQKASEGYTLFDLGINMESDIFKASAIVRLKNPIGGFFADGASVNIRQVQIEGTIAKKVKYEIGDVYLSQTAYTINNFEEIYNDYEAEIFKIRRRVVNYENFFIDNKWRTQGVNGMTRMKFSKIIKEISIKANGGRLGITDYTSIPDRFYYGGRIEVTQSQFFKIGGNLIAINDVQRTVAVSQHLASNMVATSDFKLSFDKHKNFAVGLSGELGMSQYSYERRTPDTLKLIRNDYFYDAGIYAEVKPINLKVNASYRNVGPGFISPMAQTRRIFDVKSQAYIFPNYNDGSTVRAITLMDRYSQETGLYNKSISTQSITFNPIFNNITPYGQATPNRSGYTLGLSYGKADKFLNLKFGVDKFKEIYTEDSLSRQLRDFTGLKGGFVFNLHKLVDFKKTIILQAGGRQEVTKRTGLESVNLTSTLIDLGAQVEIVKNFFLLGGSKFLTAKGNEYLTNKNEFNRISLLANQNFNLNQQVWALGMKYNFGKAGSFTFQYHFVDYKDKSTYSSSMTMNQVFAMYNLQF